MKVVYSIATRIGGSGIGTTAAQAVQGIYRAGFLTRVWASSRSDIKIPNHLISATKTDWLERLPGLQSYSRWYLKDLGHDLLVSRLLGAADIFHVWNGHGLYSLRRAKKLGARVVVERASSHPRTYERIMNQELEMRGLKTPPFLALNKRRLLSEISEADFITVPSDFAYRSMVENDVPGEKLVQIPFGVDLNVFCPALEKPRSSSFNVLFVGQVGFRKGVLYLLEAWRNLNLKDAKLRILGQEDREVQTFLHPYRNISSIKFLGFGSSLESYQDSDLFVFPSLEEGSALVSYEALACGLPVITTFESGSVVEDGAEGYLVPVGSVTALAEKIEYLYENPRIRAEMSIRARVRAQSFSWQKYGEKLTQFYEKIY